MDLAAVTKELNASKAEVNRMQQQLAAGTELEGTLRAEIATLKTKGGSEGSTGFSIVHLILVALVCFLIGRFL